MHTQQGKKNILIVTSMLNYGGAETVILNLCEKLNPEHFNVYVCHLLPERGPVGDMVAKLGIPVFAIKRKKGLFKYLSFINLIRFIKQKNINLVHSHTTYSFIDTVLCRIFYRNFKLVHTFHYGNFPNYNKKYSFLIKTFCNTPDKIVAVGHRQRSQIEDIYPIKREKIEVIWNGVTEKIDIDSSLKNEYKNTNKIIIGTICLFSEQKGLDILLDVMKKLKYRNNNFVLLIVGGGPLERELILKRDAYSLQDTVHFLGFYDNAATRVLPIFDIFVQSSLWEAMSMAILEAMACAKPIVATDVGDNARVIEDGGFVVPPSDVTAITDKLEQLVLNKDLREKMGNAGYERYKTCCSTEKMVRKYEKLYLSLLDTDN